MGKRSDSRQTVYIPSDMLAEIRAEGVRQDRAIAWLLQRAWKIARGEIMAVPGVNELDERKAA